MEYDMPYDNRPPERFRYVLNKHGDWVRETFAGLWHEYVQEQLKKEVLKTEWSKGFLKDVERLLG